MHPWDKKYNIVFCLLLIAGISLCIGGIWITPLLVPGAVCLTGAFGMYASAYTRMYPWKQDESNMPIPNNIVVPVAPTITNNIGIFYLFRKFSSRGMMPLPEVIEEPAQSNRLTLV
jgi:hypothetical protein